MSNIGDFIFDQWQGFMPRTNRSIERLPNFSGVDGCTLLAGAWSVEPAQIKTAYLVDDQGSADDAMESFRGLMTDDNLQGLQVTDSLGFTYDSVTVLSVQSIASQLLDGTWRVDSVWSLQCQALEP